MKGRTEKEESWLLGTVVLFFFVFCLSIYGPPLFYTHSGARRIPIDRTELLHGLLWFLLSLEAVHYNVEYIKERAPSLSPPVF